MKINEKHTKLNCLRVGHKPVWCAAAKKNKLPITVSASVTPLPRDWHRRSGRPRHTWLRTIESDLAPLNIGLATAYHRAQNRQAWSKLVGTATSTLGQAT